MNCQFCDTQTIEKQKIYETSTAFVIYNIRPANKGQCVVIPKRHITNIRDLSDDECAILLKLVKLVSEKLEEYLKPAGFNYGWNEGKYAGQSIEHVHIHVLPRFENDAVFKHHLFHRKQEDKKDLTEEELTSKVKEFRKIF